MAYAVGGRPNLPKIAIYFGKKYCKQNLCSKTDFIKNTLRNSERKFPNIKRQLTENVRLRNQYNNIHI